MPIEGPATGIRHSNASHRVCVNQLLSQFLAPSGRRELAGSYPSAPQQRSHASSKDMPKIQIDGGRVELFQQRGAVRISHIAVADGACGARGLDKRNF